MRGRTGTAQLPLGPEEMLRLEAAEHATQHRDDRPVNDEPRR